MESALVRLPVQEDDAVTTWARATAAQLAGMLRSRGVTASAGTLAVMLDRRVELLGAALGWPVERSREFVSGEGLDDIVAVMAGP